MHIRKQILKLNFKNLYIIKIRVKPIIQTLIGSIRTVLAAFHFMHQSFIRWSGEKFINEVLWSKAAWNWLFLYILGHLGIFVQSWGAKTLNSASPCLVLALRILRNLILNDLKVLRYSYFTRAMKCVLAQDHSNSFIWSSFIYCIYGIPIAPWSCDVCFFLGWVVLKGNFVVQLFTLPNKLIHSFIHLIWSNSFYLLSFLCNAMEYSDPLTYWYYEHYDLVTVVGCGHAVTYGY